VKILFYNHTGQVGGAERLLLNILPRLDRARFDPLLVCPAEGPLRHLATEAGIRTETIGGLRARFTWRIDHFVRYLKSFVEIIVQLRQKVLEANPDVVHANSVRAGLVATAATFGRKTQIVWHIHDLLPHHPFNPFIRATAGLSRRTRIIAVAQASADRFVGNFAGLRKRLTVLPNGIDKDKFHSSAAARRRIRSELGIDTQAPVIGMIGRLTPSKGQLELLRLFPKVLREFPNATLVIAGAPSFNQEQEYSQLLDRTVRDLGISDRVRMLGSREDVADIMQSLDLLVINSASEACSLVILEAMACGTAVLATRTGGTPEIVEHLKNGWLVEWRNENALTEGILNLMRLAEFRDQLANEARRRITELFSLDRLMTDLQKFYLDTGSQKPAMAAKTRPAKIETDFA
jgi:glycosyltransferase involved in cell wall biosynthesis